MKHLIIFAVLAVSCVCVVIQQPKLTYTGRAVDGQPLTLKCETDTTGITKYEFEIRGFVIGTTTSNTYYWKKATQDTITCTAYKNNEKSKQSDALKVEVQPAKPSLKGRKAGFLDQELELTCNTSTADINSYTFKLQRSGKSSYTMLKEDYAKPVYKIENFKNGYYTCFAKNDKNNKKSEESNRVKVVKVFGVPTITYPDDNAATLPQVPVLLLTLLTLVTSLVVKM